MTWPAWRDPVADPPPLDSSDFPATSGPLLTKDKHGRIAVATLEDWTVDPAECDPFYDYPRFYEQGRDHYELNDVTGWMELPPL